MTHQPRAGFTLIELSIVLVILGLLIGGVLTGQSLIRAAELRSVTTQYQRYATAVNTFRDKYFALPGDMTNAQSYWGAATCDLTTASTTATTCNGDGDGLISASGATSNEAFRFWQHLANAGLIEGSYNGIAQGSTNFSATTANTPSGRIASSLWYAQNWATTTVQTIVFDGAHGNGFQFGGFLLNSTPLSPVLKPEEAYNIDTKTDDGKPATGKIIVRTQSGITVCTDASNSASASANYLLSSAAMTCALLFHQQF